MANSSVGDEDRDYEYAEDFALSCVFRDDLHAGFLKRDKATGRYVQEQAAAMLAGYAMAKRDDTAQLARYSPDRPLPPGVRKQIEDERYMHSGAGQLSEADIRAVLKVVGGSPV